MVNLARKLRDVNITVTPPKPSNLLVSLQCGHMFTVDYLDDHCRLSDYYARDSTGRWSSLKPPPAARGLVPPICPSCSDPITARRYSRVRNWAMKCITELKASEVLPDSL